MRNQDQTGDAQPLLVADTSAGYEELDWYDGPVAFFTRSVPGAPAGRYYASLVDQPPEHGGLRTYRAVRVPDDATHESLFGTDPDMFAATIAQVQEGRDSVLFLWEEEGFRFLSSGPFPEGDLPPGRHEAALRNVSPDI